MQMMMQAWKRIARGLAVLCLLLVGWMVTACSGSPPAAAIEAQPTASAAVAGGEAQAGRQVWVENSCGACHTLAAAQATGTVGPNLDESSLSFDQVVARVADGKDTMPAYAALLTPQQIADVAQFVVAGAPAAPAGEQPASDTTPGSGEMGLTASAYPADLSSFAAAWSSGDLAAIRSQYATDAIFLSAEDVVALQRREPVSAGVEGEAFEEEVRAVDGQTMRILGEPLQVTDKQVMFFFRWEGEAEGTDGVALLRAEDGKVWMHVYARADAPTPNPAPGSEGLAAYDVEPLMQAWRSADFETVRANYTEALAIYNDEDILLALQGDFHTQAELDGGYLRSELSEHGSWGMEAGAPAVRLGELVLFPWHWASIDHPAGYGVRLLRLDRDRVSQDIRFALRPWEATGGSFASGY